MSTQTNDQVVEIEDIVRINQLIDEFKPFIVKKAQIFDKFNVFSLLQPFHDKHVDISCADKGSGKFNGDSTIREKVKIKLGSFLECFNHRKCSKEHWLDSADLDLYLSQFTLQSKNSLDSFMPSSNSNKAETFDINESLLSESVFEYPQAIKELRLDIFQTNLWVNIDKACTNYHYDSNHNFLYVIDGKKDVYLIPPTDYSSMTIQPVHTSASNHCTEFPSFETKHRNTMLYTLTPGDFLFIPEGWLHGVVSAECTIAINIWFRSAVYRLLNSPQHSHILPYVLRQTIRTLIDKSLDEMNSSNDSTKTNSISPEKYEIACKSYHNKYGRVDNRGINKKTKKRGRNEAKLQEEQALFVDLSDDFMCELWPQFAGQNPDIWTEIFFLLELETLFSLTKRWDKWENSSGKDEFFEKIFQPFGERVVEARKKMILARDNLAKNIALNMLSEVAGYQNSL